MRAARLLALSLCASLLDASDHMTNESAYADASLADVVHRGLR